MKRIIYILSVICIALMANSCYDRDIIDYKEGVTLPTVTELKYTLTNPDKIKLEWNIPGNIPDEMKRPVSVYIQVYRNTTVPEHQIVLTGEPASWEYTMQEPDAKYKVTVKMVGKLKEKTYGQSDDIYSLGQTVDID
ncbi:DUF4945 domain-containing protein [Dysgonomonas termitidis]|uniref:DUF4945 domain-containing protein n=1 Tax=Dysgonomonas termitidis TaxID=1516126 RepID=A0ABV9L1E5_9BACT